MKVKILIPIILIVLAGLFYAGYRLGGQRAESVLKPTIDAQNSEIQKYITRIGDDSVFIAQKDTEILSQREAIKRGDLERRELRALNLKQANELTRLNLRIDTLLEDVSHNGEVVIIHDTVTINKEQNCILLPFTFNKVDEWLTLKGDFNSQGKLDISLKTNLSLNVWTGVTRKTREYTTLITSDSPYIGVIGIKSQKYDLPKPKPYGIGLQIGYGISRNGLSPFVGVGLNYNIIRF